MYNKDWFKNVVLAEKRKSFPKVVISQRDWNNREYIWFFLATPISPFMKGFNQTCRWIYEEQDKYNPKYCDLYFRTPRNPDMLIRVDSINDIEII